MKTPALINTWEAGKEQKSRVKFEKSPSFDAKFPLDLNLPKVTLTDWGPLAGCAPNIIFLQTRSSLKIFFEPKCVAVTGGRRKTLAVPINGPHSNSKLFSLGWWKRRTSNKHERTLASGKASEAPRARFHSCVNLISSAINLHLAWFHGLWALRRFW